jgi:hypothetical protein
MPRAVLLGLLLSGAWCGAASAHHFAIDLEARASAGKRSAQTDTLAPGVKPKPRPVLPVKAGEQIQVQWTLTSREPKASFKNVIVHFFVVKQDEVGQQRVPELTRGVVVESALTMDFHPGEKTRGAITVTLDQPGAYLLRLETMESATASGGHEHFAALDLLVR